MSHENVEVRTGRRYFNRGATSWTRDSVAEDVVWGTTGAFPGLERVYQGPAGVEEWVRAVRSEWEDFQVSLDEVIGQAGDSLAVVERIWGRGSGSRAARPPLGGARCNRLDTASLHE